MKKIIENKKCISWNSWAFLFWIYFLQKKMFFHFVALLSIILFFFKKWPLIIEQMWKNWIIDNWRIIRMADEISILIIFIILILSWLFSECLYENSNYYNVKKNNEKYKNVFNYMLFFLLICIIVGVLSTIIWIIYAITHWRQ
jgi:hypothetical protein